MPAPVAPAASADAVCSVWQTLADHNGAARRVGTPPNACSDPVTGAPDESQQPPCTTCLPSAVQSSRCEWWYLGKAPSIGGCQALQADGLPGGEYCQTITWCGQQREGDVFADACFCGSGTAWIAPDYKQPGIDSAVCLQFGSNWGWHMLWALGLLGSLYAVGGMVVARRGGAKELGIRAHPHARQWQELGALCSDGLAFARNKCRAPSGTQQLLPKRRDCRGDSTQRARRTSKKAHSAKAASKSSQNTEDPGGTSSGSSAHGSKEGHEVQHPPAPGREIAETASGGAVGLGSSAAGGGGRWVHVPA